MTELLPLEQAAALQRNLLEYLGTTFALSDPTTRQALTAFLDDADSGLFRGPYVRARLPFRVAEQDWRDHLDVYNGPAPYGHQARAFERLSTKHRSRPLPTVLTTGTGSGKTEAFLAPILDHVVRAKRAGIAGTKALILYPMNALANDQAQRIATAITSTRELAGVTGALYTGDAGAATTSRTRVGPDGLITDRDLIRDTAPDILLTNYKMLDQLLLRAADAPIWRQSALSLRYLVIDEFHTYDGAQGTDVALLLRRLALTLASHWPAEHPDLTPQVRERPLGLLTPVATSATLGDQDDPSTMRTFAATVTGVEFEPEAVITESRQALEEWIDDARDRVAARGLTPLPVDPTLIHDVDATLRAHEREHEGSAVQIAGNADDATRALLSHLYRQVPDGQTAHAVARDWAAPDLTTASLEELVDLVKAHPFLNTLVEEATGAVELSALTRTLLPTLRLRGGRTADPAIFLTVCLSVLSHLRAAVGRAMPSIEAHLWVRELTRIDRYAAPTPSFRWHDDGGLTGSAPDAEQPHTLPAIYCRHCGRSGWGVLLTPTGTSLESEIDPRGAHAGRNDRFRPLIFAPREADDAERQDGQPRPGLQWLNVSEHYLMSRPPMQEDVVRDAVLPVLTHTGDDAARSSTADTCPACDAPDGIRFLGSAIATMLSVGLSGLFGDAQLDEREKKALVFTDSVQDAAHRAGFVQSRSHVLTLRSVLREAIPEDEVINLVTLRDEVLRLAGDDPIRRYRLLHPTLADREQFAKFWREPGRLNSRVRGRVAKRLDLDIAMELGLRSTVGRTLEETSTVLVDVDAPLVTALAAARDALTAVGSQQLGGLDPDATDLTHWVMGVLWRMRTRGAIAHPWFEEFRREDGNRWRIWGGRARAEGMPGFGPGQSAPGYPYIGGKAKGEDLEPASSARGWYAGWTVKTLQVDRAAGAALSRALLVELAKRGLIGQQAASSGLTTFHLDPSRVVVGRAHLEDMHAHRTLLGCQTCGGHVRGGPDLVERLTGAPCVVDRCTGRLESSRAEDNYYRRLYGGSSTRRIVAREHTSLLPTDVRLDYETRFKSSDTRPDAPNVLVATPTLEMGIDIGDLSTVVLASLPRSVASYLQRVGRAGRLTGNALTVAFVTGRGQALRRLGMPLETISGAVRPPATYLSALEILRRQYLASAADVMARTPGAAHPRTAIDALDLAADDGYLRQLIELAELPAAMDRFCATLPQLGESLAALRDWATPRTENSVAIPGTSELAERCRLAASSFQAQVDELTFRIRDLETALPELQRIAETPAASESETEDLRTTYASLRLARRRRADLTGKHWIAVMEQAGLFPNYTLLDDAVELNVALSWLDPETDEYEHEDLTLERASARALREFAPGATFYGRGYGIRIDAVDLGRDGEAIEIWQCCPDCGYVAVHQRGRATAIGRCPRCRSEAIADVSQQLETIVLTEVSSTMRRDDAVIDDRRDERRAESFTVRTLADIDADACTSWFAENTGFGVRHARDLTLRWVNLGRGASRGAAYTLAGSRSEAPLFRVCARCGQLDGESGANSRREHRPWCPQRKETTENTVSIALGRVLVTEGLLLRLPERLTLGERLALPSLMAAVRLALREHLGGDPDHLAVSIVVDPSPDGGTADALLVHDTVPGGTGYVEALAHAPRLWDVLHETWALLRDCPCGTEERPCCERCLLPYAPTNAIETVSRAVAERLLRNLLIGTADAEPEASMGWTITRDEPRPEDPESHLEQLFREVLRQRLEALGATIRETPGPYGTAWQINLPAGGRWRLEPQPFLHGSRPDFVLTSARGDVPPTAVFTDGYRYHAIPGRNRLADDAEKRERLRAHGYRVLSLTWQDLRTPGDTPVSVPWYADLARQTVQAAAGHRLDPHALDLVTRSPFELLIDWLHEPDATEWEGVAQWLPWLVAARSTPVLVDEQADLAGVALAVLRSQTPPGGTSVTLTWKHGQLALALRPRDESTGTIAVAAVLDDADSAFDDAHQESWQEWLRLSNLLNFRYAETAIVTSSQVESGHLVLPAPAETVIATDSAAEFEVAEWEEALADAEESVRRVLLGLVDLQHAVPGPVVGLEVGDGIPIDLAWEKHHVIAHDGDLADGERADLLVQGWRIVPLSADAIREALGLALS
ncbi:uncharacterized protein DUF1998 [Salana multivorans]|uniref:Uncharacterized protein DUF1998 n=1 Tax=Salana multivorans TaxID=120377 RepID=A0A3N2D216_9MICO|nr:DEAD/DEAH box helicase [Salana multivorans]ROR93803.1 uncharacterized protein DUF1998 [Salana multivorans]